MPTSTGPKIVKDGLVFHVDAADINSYVSGSTTWYNLAGADDGTLTNGPSYSISNKGILSFDGVDDYVSIPETDLEDWSISTWAYYDYDSSRGVHVRIADSTTNNSGDIYPVISPFTGISSLNFDTTGSIYFGTFGMGVWSGGIETWFGHKLDSTGSLDLGFNQQYNVGSAVNQHDTYIGNDGYLYTCGTNLNTFARRNKETGELITQISANASTVSSGFIIDEDERKVYHKGTYYTTFSGSARDYLVKFDLDTFEVDPIFDTSNGLNAGPESIYLTSDKYVYAVGGNISSYGGTTTTHIAKIDQSGSLDPNFNSGTGFDDTRDLRCALDPQDRLVCMGRSFNNYSGSAISRLIRINTDGTLDTTFNPAINVSRAYSVNIQDDEKILVTGYLSASGSSASGIARFNPDGTLDNDFDAGTGFNQDAVNGVCSAWLQPDGNILLSVSRIDGKATYNGTSFNTFLRIDNSGSIDNTFNTGSGFTDATRRSGRYTRIKNTSGTLVTDYYYGLYPGNGGRQRPQLYRDSLNGWKFITYVKDSTNTLTIYLNGEAVDTYTFSTSSYQNLDLNIDQLMTSLTDVGSISIYDKVLTESEIQKAYNAQKSRFNL